MFLQFSTAPAIRQTNNYENLNVAGKRKDKIINQSQSPRHIATVSSVVELKRYDSKIVKSQTAIKTNEKEDTSL